MSDERNDESDSESGRALPLDGVLDLHAFQPRELGDLLPTWLAACREAGLRELRVVHGKGRGALRRSVHAILARHPDVAHFRLAGQDRGGWGATLVTLRYPLELESADGSRSPPESLALTFSRIGDRFLLHAEQLLETPVEPLFRFLTDVRSFEALALPSLRLQVAGAPMVAGQGTLVDAWITLYLRRFSCRARLSLDESSQRFAVEQLRGPCLRWRHEHRFESLGAQTRLVDHVEYGVRGGALVDSLLARPQLRRIFRYRSQQLARRFGRSERAPGA